ncbi:hypothetical protein PYCCODRAFT_1365587 [Trametes coccinea BRFM310]|uniref:Tubulin-tyrosine ligase n=1 Tax=Trametes coccinea (strain BRFM310) TaxID=1353009 RepID=A0A1Y2ITK5_TRAC3|nr:hypothetical protein PYCCODRAFT_1365587 [Trametes coccinea BRFM310]
MDDFTAFVSWPSAPLTDRLVREALDSLSPRPSVVTSLSSDLVASPGRLLQWATYDALEHDLTFSHPPGSKVLSSSYVIRKALIRKHYLSRCVHNYLIKHPGSILAWGVPRTWELEISFADELDELWGDDLYDLSDEIDKQDPSKWWILKPGMADRGMGLRLFHTKDELQEIFEEFEQDDSENEDGEEGADAGRKDTAVVTSQLRHFVIQEYLGNPLLLDPAEVPLNGSPVPPLDGLRGHKFHLRVYCVASGAIKVYVYDRILALFSAVPYGPPSAQRQGAEDCKLDLAAHLTNTSLQTERGEAGVRLLDELVGCHVLSSPTSNVNERRSDSDGSSQITQSTIRSDDISAIKSQICDVLAETFKAAIEMSVHFQLQSLQAVPNAFELFGIDFVVTHNPSLNASQRFQVNLLEVNSEPAIELTGPRLTWILEDLFKATAKTCVEPFFLAEDSPTKGELERWQVGETRDNLTKCLDLEIRGLCILTTLLAWPTRHSFDIDSWCSATYRMSANTSNIVFDDIFTINAIDKEGKKFDRVSRLYAHSKNYDMDLTLDYNVELFPLQAGQSFALALASSLSRAPQGAAGTEDEDKDRDVWRPDAKGRRGLDDDYEYVMYGKVYRFDSGSAEIVTAYASFGGLLMSLTGSFRHMTSIVLGDPVFILLRR